MISVEHREAMRRAYFVDEKSIRQIAREYRCSRKTIRKAVAAADPPEYTLVSPRPSPVLGPFKARIDELMAASEKLPRKQRYTAKRIYDVIRTEGFQGSAPTVIGCLFAVLSEQGIEVSSMRNKANRLEEMFVSLLS